MPHIQPRIYPASTAQHLANTGMVPLLARIYAARGIAEITQLNTDLRGLLPFTLLKNASDMAVILADAISAQRNILIVADYDADGATACAVGLRGLRAMGAKVSFIVPNRFEYGYGLTPEIVRLAAEVGTAGVGDNSHTNKPDIILTVDNGISSVEGVAEATRLGMEVLITDHHLPGDILPDARCIVNPNQHGCTFPSKNLAGVGVMFYVLLALRAELRSREIFNSTTQPNLAELLDIVALGTVADVVKLDENNRILVQQGLQRIRAGRACVGIQAILAVARKDPAKTSAYELGFVLGPRLNAAGRLDDISLGIQCLTTDDATLATAIAAQLDTLNHERRAIEADMQQAALLALEKVNPADNYSLTLFDASWHQGVIGILASRLKDKFHRPTIAFARSLAGEIKGSGRSITGLHLRDALDLVAKQHPHLLQKFGGHAMAAGLSLREQDFTEFQLAFETVVQNLLPPAHLNKIIETDGALNPPEFSLDIAHSLEQQVWGQGFPPPIFNNHFTVKNQRVVGEKHLKLKLALGNAAFDAILFFNIAPMPEKIHAAYKLSVNEYNGNTTLQLILEHWE